MGRTGHVAALVVGLGLSGYAASRVGASRTLLDLAVWFGGAIVVHDLLLLPFYSVADGQLVRAAGRAVRRGAVVPWVNHVRIPVLLSGLLLLAWFPLVLRLAPAYRHASGRSDAPYLWRWLAVTAVLALASATAYAVRVARVRRG